MSFARPAGWLAAVLAVGWVATVLGVALARIGYPYELEWMGGAFVDHVCRVLDGEPIYTAPTADHVPFLYGPLYFHVAALVARLTGEGFLPLRLVSLGATVATWALLFALVRGRTRRALPALVAVGLYAAGYVVVDTWYDLSRADSLFVALTAATLLALDRARSWRGALLAAALLTLAYLAKQTALLLAPPFAVALAIRAPRLGLTFAVAFAGLWGAANGVLSWLSDGWYWFYTWTLPRRHEYTTAPLWTFWTRDLTPLWPAATAALLWAGDGLAHRRSRRATLADGAAAMGLILAALSSRLHVGGAINVLMPAILGFAWLGGLAWQRGAEAARPLRVALLGLLTLQLGFAWIEFDNVDDPHPPRWFSPRRYVPDAADRAYGDALVQLLRQADGEVLVPFHGYLPRLAGKRSGAHAMALIDVERSGEPELYAKLEAEFVESARARNAALVVVGEDISDPRDRIVRLLQPGYVPDRQLAPLDSDVFFPVVGLRSRPIVVFRRTP